MQKKDGSGVRTNVVIVDKDREIDGNLDVPDPHVFGVTVAVVAIAGFLAVIAISIAILLVAWVLSKAA